VCLSKSPILYTFSTLTPPKTLISGPKKISHSRYPTEFDGESEKKNSVFVDEDFEKWVIRLLEKNDS
jgi:hypothetical protein